MTPPEFLKKEPQGKIGRHVIKIGCKATARDIGNPGQVVDTLIATK